MAVKKEGPERNIIFLTVKLTSSQLLWMLMQDLHKIKPVSVLAWRVGAHEPPLLTEALWAAGGC